MEDVIHTPFQRGVHSWQASANCHRVADILVGMLRGMAPTNRRGGHRAQAGKPAIRQTRMSALRGCVLLALSAAGCARPVLRESMPERVAIFAPAGETLLKSFPGATTVLAENFTVPSEHVLIVPAVSDFPVALWTPLREYLDRGGRAVFIGCDPFAARATSPDLLTTARPAEPLSSVANWKHENDRGPQPGPSPAASAPWPAIQVAVEDFRDWDQIVVENLSGMEGTSLAFYARGDAATGRLVVIGVESDGSHWHHVLAVSETWQPFVLHAAAFQYWYGGVNRGQPGDHLSLARLKRLAIGLSMHLGAQTPGRHSFGVSEVRLAADPRPVEHAVGWPDLMLMSPPYRRYTIRPGLQSPLARARGPGAPYRWIPLHEEHDSKGHVLGWPASMYADAKRRWAWIGMDNPPRELIVKAVRALEEELPSPPEPLPAAPMDRGEWVTVKDGYFHRAGRPLIFNGINYWPLSHNGKAPGEFNPHWLEPSWFDLEMIRRDLDRLRELGVNAVSIQYHEESQAPQLRWFVHECRQRSIWVHLFVGHLQPLDQDLAKAQRLIEAADLKNLPTVFAIDVAWEPKLGPYADRTRFDPQWQAWVIEQYGSVEHAEEVIGRPFLTRNGVITAPSDEDLKTDGPHRAMVAAYRRFVDDHLSRRYGEVVRLIRRLGCRQLVSARSGFGGTGNPWADPFLPVDPATGIVHFDFTCAEGYALTGAREQFLEGTFLTAYARGIGAGKPAIWIEFGTSVGVDPQPLDLQNQARVYRNMFELARLSRAAGMFGWWYPGGWRVDERSDYGVVNPDSTLRPAALVMKEQAGAPFRARPEWTGRTVDRFVDARGLSGLWNRWRAEYRAEASAGRVQEVRPAGFGKLTTELPLLSLGDRPFTSPAPLKFVNAEWGRIEVDGVELARVPGETIRVRQGQTLRLELINTGPATWANVHIGDTAVTALAFGGRTWITWTGARVLRPALPGAGEFGEPLEVQIQP